MTIDQAGDLTTIIDPDGVTALAADTLPTITADGGSVRPVVRFSSPETYILANPGKGTSGNPAPQRDRGGALASVKNPRGYETSYELDRLWAPDR